LISVRAPVGPTNLAKEECCIGRGLAAIRAKADIIDRDYLWYFLKASESKIVEKGQGSTFEAINSNDLNFLEIPVVKPEDQRRIAARLKAQLAEVGKARKAAETQQKETSALFSRHCNAMLNKLKDATRVPLGELLLGIEAGKSFKTKELLARSNELGVLKVSAVSWNQFQPQEAKAVAADYKPDKKHRVLQGDLIISRANTLELVGAVVRAPKDYPLRLLSDKTLRLLVDEKTVESDYLLNVLRWPEARAHIEHNATGTSDSMRNISQKTINSIPVPLVSKDLQSAIVQKFNTINDEVVKIETAVKKSLSDIALLPQKLLSQAFEMN
jgi:type I restriction enzyme S subunit